MPRLGRRLAPSEVPLGASPATREPQAANRLRMVEIVIATRNRHKVRELTGLLRVPGIRWRSLTELREVPKIRETGRTFEANAIKKARAIARATGLLALADDSGLEVDALGGAPGIHSARFAGSHGDDEANNRTLLRLLRKVPQERRGARYRCVLALADPEKLVACVEGAWQGRIAAAPKGRAGFGYDPLFVLSRYGHTVGQIPARLKQRLSHRAMAARRLRPLLVRLARKAATPHGSAGRDVGGASSGRDRRRAAGASAGA